MATVVIEGWRFLPHSYSLWAMGLALQLLERPEIELYFRDAPLADARWSTARGVLPADQEAKIAAIPALPEGAAADVVARIVFPYDFSPSTAKKTLVFGTAEYGVVPNTFMAGGEPVSQAAKRSGHTVVTCSKWSREGFLRSGVKASQMAGVICGVDTGLFHPVDDESRTALRRRLGWDGHFILFHSSSLGWNKNVEAMLDGMLALHDEVPNLRLVIKGMDALYGSGQVIERVKAQASPEIVARLLSRVAYVGESWPMERIADLYRAADAYVCPYLAEGFNMPALESAACGTPVICTAGGSTDDFMRPEFSLRVASKVQIHRQTGGKVLEPSFEEYLKQVRRVVNDAAFRAEAREKGPAFVRQGWTWRHAADQLLAAAGLAAPEAS